MATADINASDSAALRQVDGIDADLAQAIVEFRDRSGPFASVGDLDRLGPFQALSEVRKEAIRAQLTADPVATAEIDKRHREPLDLNRAGVEELTTIRGLGTARAEAIVKWRDARHGFTSVDEIDSIPEFADAPAGERERLKGYMTV